MASRLLPEPGSGPTAGDVPAGGRGHALSAAVGRAGLGARPRLERPSVLPAPYALLPYLLASVNSVVPLFFSFCLCWAPW